MLPNLERIALLQFDLRVVVEFGLIPSHWSFIDISFVSPHGELRVIVRGSWIAHAAANDGGANDPKKKGTAREVAFTGRRAVETAATFGIIVVAVVVVVVVILDTIVGKETDIQCWAEESHKDANDISGNNKNRLVENHEWRKCEQNQEQTTEDGTGHSNCTSSLQWPVDNVVLRAAQRHRFVR